MTKIKTILKIFYGILILFLVVIIVSVFASYNGFTNGVKLYTVQSGSMEPAIHVGSMIVSKPQKEYLKNDIITFYLPENNSKETVTHRIHDIKTENGESIYVTKGDANNTPDTGVIKKSNILGKLLFSIPFIGYIIAYSRTQTGLVILIIIPSTLIVYTELVNIKNEIIRLIKKRKSEKTSN